MAMQDTAPEEYAGPETAAAGRAGHRRSHSKPQATGTSTNPGPRNTPADDSYRLHRRKPGRGSPVSSTETDRPVTDGLEHGSALQTDGSRSSPSRRSSMPGTHASVATKQRRKNDNNEEGRSAAAASDQAGAREGRGASSSPTAQLPSLDAKADKVPRKRRKVNHACVYCRRSHMTCDQNRPCSRCIKRDIGHLCHDEPRDTNKTPSKSEDVNLTAAESASKASSAHSIGSPSRSHSGLLPDGQQSKLDNGQRLQSAQTENTGNSTSHENTQSQGNISNAATQDQQQQQQSLQRPPVPQYQPSTVPSQALDYNNNGTDYQGRTINNNTSSLLQTHFPDMHNYHPDFMFGTSEVTDEYNLMNDFLSTSILEDPSAMSEIPHHLLTDQSVMVAPDGFQTTTNAYTAGSASQFDQAAQPTSRDMPVTGIEYEGGPGPSRRGLTGAGAGQAAVKPDKAQEKYYMTAADPAGDARDDDRMNKVLMAKYDAGLLKPFNYVEGYTRLNRYMEGHLQHGSKQRIRAQLEKFRPQFRRRVAELSDFELVQVEFWFEQKLMEIDRVFASMAVPACCWRRTGEIFRANEEMAELINVPIGRLRDGKLALHEMLSESSLVAYWEKFGSIAFDTSRKAMLTSCWLQTPESCLPQPGHSNNSANGSGSNGNGTSARGERPMQKCCFSFTVQRDEHQIPTLIIGNFIPIPTTAAE